MTHAFVAVRSSLACLVASSGLLAQEFNISDFAVRPGLGVEIAHPTATNTYHVLFRSTSLTGFRPTQISLRTDGTNTFTDLEPLTFEAYYQIARFSFDAPGDVDGDGLDDVEELRRGRDPFLADSPNLPPVANVTLPLPGAAFAAGAEIQVEATATDPDGTVVRVEFYAGNFRFGEATTPPFRADWSNAPGGRFQLTARAYDERGAWTTSRPVPITVGPDNSPPFVRLARPLSGEAFRAPAVITLNANAEDADGRIVKVEFFNGSAKLAETTQAPFAYAWQNVPAGEYVLTVIATDDLGWTTTSYGVPIRVTLAEATPLATFSSSPTHRESGVSLTRETVLRFTYPLAPDALVGPNTLYALHGGRRILSRTELSSDRQTLTLFYLENLPASSRIRVRFNADGLRDFLGREVDADGDGQTGGYVDIDFDTVSITPVEHTAISGRVFRSDTQEGELNPTNVIETPLEGVQIVVIGADETMRTQSDPMGNFTLSPCPVGRFFVQIDGRTSTNGLAEPHLRWADRDYYPLIEKAWEAAPGRTNLAGGSGTIFLPLVRKGTLQTVSATTDTVITFPDDVVSRNPDFAGVSITVPANALVNTDGTRGGRIGLAPVSPNRLPEPLPPGLEHVLDISIQTDGPQNFDQPLPARFPNLPDPRTREKLPPGAKTVLWSYDHDEGAWVVSGTMTVTEDGNHVESDPGQGIRKPGWHGVWLGAQARDAGAGPACEQAYLDALAAAAAFGVGTIAAPLAELVPGIGCAVSLGVATASTVISCSANKDTCGQSIVFGAIDGLVGCVPGTGLLGLAISLTHGSLTLGGVYQTVDELRKCETGAGAPIANGIPEDLFAEQDALTRSLGDLYNEILGNPKWTALPPSANTAAHQVFQSLQSSLAGGSPGGFQITAEECRALSLLPRPVGISDADIDHLCSRLNRFLGGDLADLNLPTLLEAATRVKEVASELETRGWGSTIEAFVGGRSYVEQLGAGYVKGGSIVAKPLAYSLGGSHGRTGPSGTLPCVNLSPNASYTMVTLGSVSSSVSSSSSSGGASFGKSSVTFRTGMPGTCVGIPSAVFELITGPDSDEDGLPDEAEEVLRTNARLADTDGDGISDSAEFLAGTNPLDGLPAATGIIASADTGGTAVDVCAVNNVAVVADGEAGVTVFNVFAGTNPLRIAQVDTPGFAWAVSCSGNLIAVADGEAGLAIVNVSDPPAAQLVRRLPLSGVTWAVAASAGIAFVGTTAGEVVSVELESRAVLQRAQLPKPVHDLAVEASTLYALLSDELRAFDFSDFGLRVLGSAPVSTTERDPLTRRGRLFAGGGYAYAASRRGHDAFDVRDPAAMVRIGNAPGDGPWSFKQIVANGSGLGIAAVGVDPSDRTHDIYLYDLNNPADTTAFLTAWPTPDIARAASIYNGLAYVADSAAGIHVINYLAYDSKGVRPSGVLSVSAQDNAVPEGGLFFIRASVADDVQVRNVEFSVDGRRVATDGNFPFEHGLRLPPGNVGGVLNLSAIVTDTGGNSTNLGPIRITVTADNQPPVVSLIIPPQILVGVGDQLTLKMDAADNVGVESVTFLIDGRVVAANRKTRSDWVIVLPEWVTVGRHTVTVTVRDFAGYSTTSAAAGFSLGASAETREITVFSFGSGELREAVARELTAFNSGSDEPGDAISRELTVFNFGPAEGREAISREITAERPGR